MTHYIIGGESATSEPKMSPCERLWARYHCGREEDKVEILEEMMQHGCLERAERSIKEPKVPIT